MSFHDDHPKVRPVARRLTDITKQVQSARDALRELEDRRGDAVREDRQAVADALRANKPEPDESRVREADAKIAAARRYLEALQVAQADQEKAVEEAVEKNRDDWATDITKRIADGHARLAAAVDELAAARQDLSLNYSVLAWLDGRDAGEPRFLGQIGSLRTAGGEPMPWAAVEQALRGLAEPPAPQPAAPELGSDAEHAIKAGGDLLQAAHERTGKPIHELASLPTSLLADMASRPMAFGPGAQLIDAEAA